MRKRTGLVAAAVAIVALLPGALPTRQVLAGLEAAAKQAGQATHRVTLVTGDTVVVRGRPGGSLQLQLDQGKGRKKARFLTTRKAGHLSVVPIGAMPLVATGKLDERLFDITQLIAWGYDDEHRKDLPLLAEYPEGRRASVRSARVTRSLPRLGVDVLSVQKAQAGQFWRELTGGGPRARTLGAGLTKLWLDGIRKPVLNESVPQIGAPTAWKQGLTGKGVTVGVLDTGYDQTHPDLQGVVTQAKDFSDEGNVQDTVGHGTHVASTIAGSGAASQGKYRGVAPDAKIVAGKVCAGVGCADSWILAGMSWAATEVKVKVVNMSFGGQDYQGLDPVEKAVNTLTAQTGTLFVVAAGNEGADARTIGSPASADAALTVGAVTKQDELADFSSRGPRIGDGAVKPDITAPGVDIVAARSKDGWIGEPVGDKYVRLEGTSMATPHVVGAAAIVAQQHPDFKADQLKGALMSSAKPRSDLSAFQQGAGRVDVARAVTQQVTASPGNLAAYLQWPHAADQKVTRTLTYTNHDTKPVTLELRLSYQGSKGADGEPITLDKDSVTLPAQGTNTVNVTMTGARIQPDAYGGLLTATSADKATVVRTVVGAYVEPKVNELTVSAIDRTGKPAEEEIVAYRPDTGDREYLYTDGGSTKVRLPAADWNLYTLLVTPQGEDFHLTVAHLPVSLKRGNQQVVVDARQAKLPVIGVEEPSARSDLFEVGLNYRGPDSDYGMGLVGLGFDVNKDVSVLPVRQQRLTYYLMTLWEKPDATPEAPTPYRYGLADFRKGEIPQNPTYRPKNADLAKVTLTYRAQNAAAYGLPFVGYDVSGGGVASASFTKLPATTTAYFTPRREVSWVRSLEQGTRDDPEQSVIDSPTRTFDKRSYAEVWNAAVTGPVLADGASVRNGDTIDYQPRGFFTDGVPGHEGWDTKATGTITLAKDGTTIGQAKFEDGEMVAKAPAGAGTYTLTTSTQRTVPYATLSTKVETAWTFRSEHTDKKQALPLQVVRYAPDGLDDQNRAKAGSTTTVPLWVERNPGAAAATVKSITVEASFDDGANWQPLTVTPKGTGWTVDVRSPAQASFVSFRATANDSAGNSIKQIISRAYALTK